MKQNDNGAKPPFILLSSIKPEGVKWLWEGRIPLGEITLFDGDPSTNKSSVCLDLAARVSTGRQMPDGSPGVSGGVILLQAEDSTSKTVVPRLDAAGADRGQIAELDRSVVIPDNLELIQETIVRLKAKLLVIDPLSAFLGASANNDQSVRQALAPLAQLIDKYVVAVIAIRHLNKSRGQQTLYRGLGSVGIVAAARSHFVFGVSLQDPNMRIMAHSKCNLTPRSSSLLYEPIDDGNETVRIVWRGPCDFTAEQIIAQKHGSQQKDGAKRLLIEVLANGPVSEKAIEEKASAQGLSMRTLHRAKAELGIISQRSGFGKGSMVFWMFPPASRPWYPAIPSVATQ
ncbi:MAG: AAA family ATPase [Thermoguttaceae bacterium]